jgi:hypothetical protein
VNGQRAASETTAPFIQPNRECFVAKLQPDSLFPLERKPGAKAMRLIEIGKDV